MSVCRQNLGLPQLLPVGAKLQIICTQTNPISGSLTASWLKKIPMFNSKRNVAIVCGGNSKEYDISIQSGRVVLEHLDKDKYNSFLMVVRGTDWKVLLEDGQELMVNKNDFSIQHQGHILHFDVVFNAIHGSPGEDGKLLGYLEMLQIPYTGSNHIVSALTFNKNFCKQVVESADVVALAKGVMLKKGEVLNPEAMVEHLGLPVFVKPNSNGSSVGVTKVKKLEELLPAILNAFNEDEEVLIESFIQGREMGCGVFEFQGKKLVFPITEIISKKEFFDYEAKYTTGMSDEITPADVDEEADFNMKAIASELYSHLGCRGIVRFDFILTDDNIYFLEVNTVPGMSAASIIPQQAQVMGFSLKQLFDMAIENVFTV